jgi:hypothetical protein
MITVAVGGGHGYGVLSTNSSASFLVPGWRYQKTRDEKTGDRGIFFFFRALIMPSVFLLYSAG